MTLFSARWLIDLKTETRTNFLPSQDDPIDPVELVLFLCDSENGDADLFERWLSELNMADYDRVVHGIKLLARELEDATRLRLLEPVWRQNGQKSQSTRPNKKDYDSAEKLFYRWQGGQLRCLKSFRTDEDFIDFARKRWPSLRESTLRKKPAEWRKSLRAMRKASSESIDLGKLE